MRKVFVATLMALALGLFSMPAVQAAPAGGTAIGTAADALSPIEKVQRWRRRRRRRRRCGWRHYGRSRRRWRCWGWW